jgi:chromosome segregation ATPase
MGVYAAYLGKDSAGQSGVAIASLVEQGSTTLAEINDNYRFACEQLGQLILGYLIDDLAQKRNYKVTINKEDPRNRKAVAINVTQEDGSLSNDITRLSAHIALAPIQTTSIYKQQLVERLTAVTGQMPPQVQGAVFDLIAEMMDIPNKHKFIERVRNALQIPKDPSDMTPEEQQAAQQQQQQVQQQQEMAMREVMAKLAKLESEAQSQQAKAAQIQQQMDSARYDDAMKQAQTGKLLQEMQAVATENERMKLELSQLQDQLLQNIEAQLDSVA